MEDVYPVEDMINFSKRHLLNPHAAKREIEEDELLSQLYAYATVEEVDWEDDYHIGYIQIKMIAKIVVEVCNIVETDVLDQSLFVLALEWAEKFPYANVCAREMIKEKFINNFS